MPKLILPAIPAVLALFLVACGGGVPPTDRLASAESAARSAREHGAEKEPNAALHLKLADEQIDQGKKLMADGDNKRADLVLQRASADAELAVMLARESAAKGEAETAQDKVKNLKAGK
jgi:hypothetical protein